MPNVSSPSALPKYIEQLLSQHKLHSEALSTIESTLERVTSALGVAMPAMHSATSEKKRGRPFKTQSAAKKLLKPKPAGKMKQTRTGLTANDFVLAFVEKNSNPTTQQINAHWKASGRKGSADNSLSLLCKEKDLKRTKFTDGKRGSTYSIP